LAENKKPENKRRTYKNLTRTSSNGKSDDKDKGTDKIRKLDSFFKAKV